MKNTRCLAVLAAGLLLASCFEQPVQEDLTLRFLQNGAVIVTSTVVVSDSKGESNPALEKRLAETRQALLEGWDPWGPRFAAVDAAAERFSWEKRLGALAQASRSAVVVEPHEFERFFGDTSLAVSYDVFEEDGLAELTISPGPSSRATRKQRKEMERTLGEWTGRVAEYLDAGADLYGYLDDRPERARDCFGVLFHELLGEGDRNALGALSPEEKRLVDRLSETMEQVWDVLLVPKGAAHSPDEVSHLVYDPFPARLKLTLPGAPLDLEGFEVDKEGGLTVLNPSLWEALRALQGRWLAPDPVILYVSRGGQEGEEPLDLDEFLELPRRAATPAPNAVEVRRAIEERLKPAPFYKVSWKIDPEADPELDWEG
jgi:hypothetical protein